MKRLAYSLTAGRRAVLLAVVAWLLASTASPAASVAAPHSQGITARPVSIENDHVQVLGNSRGQYTIGTLAGDPGTNDDDERRLTYGHGRGGFTSFSTLRVITGGETRDVPLLGGLSRPHRAEDGALVAQWELNAIELTQRLTIADNPYTNRPDTVRIELTAQNRGNETAATGLRIMMDTMIGSNDHAPFFVPGAGNFDVEREFAGDQAPVYWKAFEASDYAPDSLKGQGIVTGLDATPPDRFVFASWRRIKDTAWDYSISPDSPVGDSAVALYWEPQDLGPGETRTWVTYYGLAGEGGGSAWIDAPVNVTSEAPEFSATLWVTNLSDGDFAGGQARIVLPEGLRLAPDEQERKPMETVPVNGGARSVSWRLIAEGSNDRDYDYSATVEFERGSDPLAAEASVSYRLIAPPAPTATIEPTATPSPTPTPVLPVAVPPPPAAQGRFPWPLLLIPLAGLPLLLLLMRRRPARPVSRVAPPRAARAGAEPDFTERTAPTGAAGSSVTHGRQKGERRDADDLR